jgi:serine/threonine protein kinase
MMSDESDQAIPKIVDFGLSKIIGPKQTANEPFGTLGYVAPEVLKKQPYTFSCDVWSIGCIAYALISGSLPFDHKDQKELMRMTLEDSLKFDLPIWNKTTKECKALLQDMLVKEHTKRISLDDVANHSFFDSVRSFYADA